MHAFVPAAHVAPHSSRRDQRARLRRATARELDRRVLRRAGRMGPVHPARIRAREAGRRGRARRLGPARWSCSPSTASITWGRQRAGGYERTVVGVQPGRRARQPQDARDGAIRRPERARSRARRRRARSRRCCAMSCRRCAARSSSERSKILIPDLSPAGARTRRFAPAAAEVAHVGAACPDHLVHTKRRPDVGPVRPERRRLDRDAGRADRYARSHAYRNAIRRVRRAPPRAPTTEPARSRSACGADRERRDSSAVGTSVRTAADSHGTSTTARSR